MSDASIIPLYGYRSTSKPELVGETITDAVLGADALRLTFSNGVVVELEDAGQSCCEHRYITTDDDPSNLIGGALLHITTKPGPSEDTDYDVHETMFVEIQTTKGFITLTTHNLHNGYYGGFAVGLNIIT